MRGVFFIFLLFWVCCLAEGVRRLCRERPCSRDLNPICGTRTVQGKLERKIFGNVCMMQATNDCGGGYKHCELTEEDVNAAYNSLA